MKTLHVWPHGKQVIDGWPTLSATLESSSGKRYRLWYGIDSQWGHAVTDHADCFALAALFFAMRTSSSLHIHGSVSPSLMGNLEEFQAIWHCWYPNRYRPVELRADIECEAPQAVQDSAVVCYSGGVDGMFTIFRHAVQATCRRTKCLGAAIFIQGFDIPLHARDAYERNASRADCLLGAIRTPVIRLRTNWRDLPGRWRDAHGAGLGACLHVLGAEFSSGLMGSSMPYMRLEPWGSTPMTDRLMSSSRFVIRDGGAEFDRVGKLRQLLAWPEGLANLRVCWEGKAFDRNCGSCEKCIRTQLAMRIAGVHLPECFDSQMTDQSLAMLNIPRDPGDRETYLVLLRHAEQAGLGRERWAQRLRERLQTSDSPSTAWMSHLRQQLSLSKAWTKIKRKCA
jgi:hypothetical protein